MRRSVAFVSVPAGILAFTSFVAAQSVTTNPAGFIKTPLLDSSDTYVSSPFTRPPEFTGAIQSISGNVITVVGTPGWTPNQFAYAAGTQPKHYYVLIGPSSAADPKEGHMYPVDPVNANGSNTLTVDTTPQNDLTGIPANTQLVLIPYWTLATVFPATDANVSFAPTTSSTAYKTQIRIPKDSTPGINFPSMPVYFFSNNVDGTTSNVGWRIVSDNTTDHGDDTLAPDSYFVVRNSNGSPTLNLTSLGAVLLKKFTLPLMTQAGQPLAAQQDNAVSILRPIDVPLDASGLGPTDGSFVANDQLLLFDNTQIAFDKTPSAVYYYDISVGNTGGWRLTGGGSTNHGSDVIPLGTGFIIRKAGTASGQTVFWTNQFRAVSAVSRRSHVSAGVFDINLPLTGTRGVECRTGGPTNDYQVVFTFPTAVTINTMAGTQGASVTSGTGSVTSTSGSGKAAVTVNLTGVTNQQYITVTLLGVNDGTNTNDVSVQMGVLVGDINANRLVNSTDISLVQAQSGKQVTNSNFRTDVNVNGLINSTDISTVQSKSGTGF